MKCDICSKTIEETFLHKPLGTQIRVNGKKRMVCQACQRLYPSKEQLFEKLGKS